MILYVHALHHICILTMIHALYMCVYYVEIMCAGRIGLGWAHDVFTFASHMFMHFSCMHTIYSLSCWYWSVLGTFLLLSLSLLVSLLYVTQKEQVYSVLEPSLLWGIYFWFYPPLTFSSMMWRPVWTSWRTFLDATFIWNAKSSYWTSLILTFPLSSTVRVGSHFMAS